MARQVPGSHSPDETEKKVRSDNGYSSNHGAVTSVWGVCPFSSPNVRVFVKAFAVGRHRRGAWGFIERDNLCGDVMRCAEQARNASRYSQGEAVLRVHTVLGRNISGTLENVDQKSQIYMWSE